jgi:hypothetical protein
MNRRAQITLVVILLAFWFVLLVYVMMNPRGAGPGAMIREIQSQKAENR